MKYRATFRLALIALILLPVVSFGKEPINKRSDAAATVRAFYAFHFKHNYDYLEPALKQRRRWLDENLYKLLLAELKKSEESTKRNEVPDLNGDPFTNSQEYPNSFQIGKSKQTADRAIVEVFFIWKEKRKVIDKKRVEVELVNRNNAWKISNIISKAEEHGDLLQFLNRSN